MNYLQRQLLLLPFLRQSAENPSTSLANPAVWLTNLFGRPTASGQTVNSETALALPAVWRAAWLNASTIASLPLKVFEKIGNNRENLSDHPIQLLLQKKPNRFQTAYIWRQLSMMHIQFWGNAYSLIVFDNRLRPEQLLPFHPSKVTPLFDRKNNRILYRFEMDDGKTITIDSAHVLHQKGISFDGLVGKSPITTLRENIGLGLAAQEFGAEFYQKGAQLDGVIEIPGHLSKDALKNLRESWENTHLKGGERTALLDKGMTYKQVGIPPDDAQFLETRKLSITDVARIFGVPPPLVYDLERATYSNIQMLVQGYAKFDLNPWLINIEQEINDKLFFEDEKNTIFVKHNLDGLLRGDPKQRAEFYRVLIQNGVMTPNQARRMENFNDYDLGDLFYILANYNPVGENQNNT